MIKILLSLVMLSWVISSHPAQARWLEWNLLDVEAQIAADGSLNVTETHHMVFTGDWNGGERRFNVRPQQQLVFEEMKYLERDRYWMPMTEGNLSEINHYGWSDDHVLRWRSRLPEDPPFNGDLRAYKIKYSLQNVIKFNDGKYSLNHDFAFPDRAWNIKRLNVTLTLESPWRSEDLKSSYTTENLGAGEGFVIRAELKYDSPTVPAHLDVGQGMTDAWSVLFGALAIFALLLIGFWSNQSRLGRFHGLLPPNQITASWLKEHVFCKPAEKIGVEWDGAVGSAEVAAILTRWMQNGWLEVEQKSSWFGPFKKDASILKFKGSAPVRQGMSGGDKILVDYFFFGGRSETSMKDLEDKYSSSISAPSDRIRSAIQTKVMGAADGTEIQIKTSFLKVVIMMLGGGIAFMSMMAWGMEYFPIEYFVPGTIVGILGSLVLLPMALYFRRYFGWKAIMFPAIHAAIPLAAFGYAMSTLDEMSSWAALACSAVGLLWAYGSLGISKVRLDAQGCGRRWALASARRYFEGELKKPKPDLRDEDAPYLVALELSRGMRGWAKRFGIEPNSGSHFDDRTRPGAISTGFTSSSSSAGWTGGGGAFGGGGASGSWVTSVTKMASGYTRPSESSSSGGSSSSSSSSSSSGGGGGGGW